MPSCTAPQPASLASLKAELAGHALHAAIDSLPRLRTFAEHHVACVWDFMSLLKSMQRDLAPARVPWLPPADPEAARLVNEIVLDEESDALPYRGGHASHFAWYIEAMEELGADVDPVRRWMSLMAGGEEPLTAMSQAGMPAASRDFVAATLALLDEPLAVRAAVFLHAREDVIPRMFLPLARTLRSQGLACTRLLAYLERHIETDGGVHADNAAALLDRLHRGEPGLVQRGQSAAATALAARCRLWDAIVDAL